LITNEHKTPNSIKTKQDLNTPLSYIQSITRLVQSGKLEEAETLTNLSLSSDSFSMTERNDLLRHLAIIHIKNTEFKGSTHHLQSAKNLLNEALDNLNSSASDYKKIRLYLEFAKIHRLSVDLKRAEQLYQKTLKMSQELTAKDIEIKATIGLGSVYLDKHNADEALDYGLLAMRLLEAQKDDILLIDAYNLIGGSYLKKRLQPQAQQYFKRALALAQQHEYAEAITIAQKNLGVLHAMNREYKDAMELFLEALEFAKAIHHRAHTAHCIINIGTIHAHLLNYKEALNRYSTAIAIYQDVLNLRNRVILLNNIGNTYYTTEQYDTALTYFSKVLALAANIDYHQMVAHAYAQLSKTYIAKNQFSSDCFSSK
jgi:tetratricopeptide (TPR) repeat protein